MSSELIPVTFNKIMQSRAYTVIILGAEEKQFAIYTDPVVGKNIQNYLTTGAPPRPLTHALLEYVLQGFDIEPIQIVINDVEDTVYFARIFLEQKSENKRRIVEIDARPSDCITLSLAKNIPLFCKQAVLEKAVPIK